MRPSVCDSFPSNLLFRRPQPSDSGLAILGCRSTAGPAPNALPADPSPPPSAVQGCESGLQGKNDRGLDLYGMLAFIQLQQCSQDRCNAKLNLTSRVLSPAGRTRGATTQTEGLGVITCCRRESEAGLGAGP